MLIDSHAHLSSKEFDADRLQVIERARQAGVGIIVNIGAGYGVQTAVDGIKIADQFENIYTSVGVHPCDAAVPFDAQILPKLAQHPKVVAIGETGLDFYRDNAPHESQYRWFRHQIEMAIELNKPLVIHSREAGKQCLETLREYHGRGLKGVFHCYAEDAAFAAELRKINFLISVPGIVTFKNAHKLREALKGIPLEQVMLETDAPFLAPQSFRGKRCESAQMVETAKALAQIYGIIFEEVAAMTTKTAREFFCIP